MKKIIWPLVAVLIFTASCAQAIDVQQFVSAEPYGFWSGLWHGFIAPVTFFVSLFVEEVAIYAVNNNGGWYDFGFVVGAGILFGGSRKRKRRRKKED